MYDEMDGGEIFMLLDMMMAWINDMLMLAWIKNNLFDFIADGRLENSTLWAVSLEEEQEHNSPTMIAISKSQIHFHLHPHLPLNLLQTCRYRKYWLIHRTYCNKSQRL